jgi:hypothetical protein
MSSSKKLTCKKGTLGQVFICLRTRIPYLPSPLNTVFVYTVYFTQGGGGGKRGELNQREGGGEGGELKTREKGRGAIVHKAGSKIPT